jgi:hypothetical protein
MRNEKLLNVVQNKRVLAPPSCAKFSLLEFMNFSSHMSGILHHEKIVKKFILFLPTTILCFFVFASFIAVTTFNVVVRCYYLLSLAGVQAAHSLFFFVSF